MGRYRKSNRGDRADFDYGAYWQSRARCTQCGGRTRKRKGSQHEVLCAKCSEKRYAQKKKAAEAAARAADLKARVEHAKAEVRAYQEGKKAGSPRGNLNAKIRAELLSVHAEASQEYVNVRAELDALAIKVKELQGARLEDFEAPLDARAIGIGLGGAFGGALGGLFFGIFLVPLVIVPVVAIVFWLVGESAKGNPDARAIPALAFIVIIAVMAIIGFFASSREDSRTRARDAQIAEAKRQMKLRSDEHDREIARLERRAEELQSQLERISFSGEARKLLWERDGKICYLCGREIVSSEGEFMHVDHVFPWSQGGSNDPENLRATHVACNLKKSDKIIGNG